MVTGAGDRPAVQDLVNQHVETAARAANCVRPAATAADASLVSSGRYRARCALGREPGQFQRGSSRRVYVDAMKRARCRPRCAPMEHAWIAVDFRLPRLPGRVRADGSPSAARQQVAAEPPQADVLIHPDSSTRRRSEYTRPGDCRCRARGAGAVACDPRRIVRSSPAAIAYFVFVPSGSGLSGRRRALALPWRPRRSASARVLCHPLASAFSLSRPAGVGNFSSPSATPKSFSPFRVGLGLSLRASRFLADLLVVADLSSHFRGDGIGGVTFASATFGVLRGGLVARFESAFGPFFRAWLFHADASRSLWPCTFLVALWSPEILSLPALFRPSKFRGHCRRMNAKARPPLRADMSLSCYTPVSRVFSLQKSIHVARTGVCRTQRDRRASIPRPRIRFLPLLTRLPRRPLH